MTFVLTALGSKSGDEDDNWFYGFRSLDDCEEFYDVTSRVVL